MGLGSKIRRLRTTPPPLKSKKSVVRSQLGKSKKDHRVRAIAKKNPESQKIKRSNLARGWKGPKHQGGWSRGASMGPKFAQMRRKRQKRLGLKVNPTTVNLW